MTYVPTVYPCRIVMYYLKIKYIYEDSKNFNFQGELSFIKGNVDVGTHYAL